MPLSTISSKGQITLPAALRRRLGIKAHDKVTVELANDEIVIKPVPDIFQLEGFLGKPLPLEVERKRTHQAAVAHGRGTGR